MTYGFINENLSFIQLDSILKDGEVNGIKIDKMEILQKLEEPDSEEARAAYNVKVKRHRTTFLNNLVDHEMKDGDILITSTFLNLTSELSFLATIDHLIQKGIRLIVVEEEFDSSNIDPATTACLRAAHKKFNRNALSLSAARHKEGIARAQSENKYSRRTYAISDFPNFEDYYNRYENNKMSKTEISEILGISRPTLDRLFRDYSQQRRLLAYAEGFNNLKEGDTEPHEN